MKALGDFLRQARETAGVSLQEIQEKTKIRLYYLEAMESGNLEALPGEVYEKGFLKNYASVVGIKEEEVMTLYSRLKSAKSAPVEMPAGEPVSASVSVQEQPVAAAQSVDPKKKNTLGKFIPFIVLLGIILGVSAGWVLIHNRKSEPVAVTPVQTAKKRTAIRPSKSKPVKTVNNLLRLQADEDVWISLTEKDTGRLIEEVTLHKGDTREWKIDRPLVLVNGNAGGLRISVFGGPFKTSGGPGEVLKTQFIPQGEENRNDE